MSCRKRKGSPPLCLTPSRRLLHSLEIQDIPQTRVIRRPPSMSRHPSQSNMCVCNQEYCSRNSCGRPQMQANRGPYQDQPTFNCGRGCKRFEGIMVDDIPCCRDMLHKLAQEALSLNANCNQTDNRVTEVQATDESCSVPCWENKPITSTASCLIKTSQPAAQSCPGQPPPQAVQSCCELPDCAVNQAAIKEEDECSPESCARDAADSESVPNTESGDTLTELQCGFRCGQPLMRPMPPISTIPSKNISGNIASKSNQKLLAKLNKKDKKTKKEEKKKNKKNSDLAAESCTHNKCAIHNPGCSCRFPPAFSQYYDCTGQIAGNCQCKQNQ